MTRALLLLCALAGPLAAQDTTGTAAGGGFRLPVRFTGEMGTNGEYYSASGRDARRPETTGEVFLRTRFTLFGQVTSGLDLLLSSEGGSDLSGTPGIGRQRLNRLGLTPEWSWGRAALGSFSDRYSDYTLSGIRMTGVGFALQPGLLRVGSVYGVTEQPVLGGATDGSFRRRLLGGRLGIGEGDRSGAGTFVDIMLLRAWDDEQSLPSPTDPVAPVGGVPVNEFAVTPQENVVAGATGGLELMHGNLRFGGEVSAAIHSRDRRAPELDEETLPSYPGFLRAMLTPRVSTHADYAYRLEARLRVPQLPGATPRSPRTLELAGDYSYIGPGYVSLGVASLPTDQRAVGLRSQVRFPRWTAGLQGRLQRDNLLGQKLATTTRHQVGANVTLRPARRWSVSLRGNRLDMGNDTDDSLRMIAYTSHTFGVSNGFSFGGRKVLRSVTLSYGYQDAGDGNPARVDNALVSHSVDLRVGLSPSRIVHVTPQIGLVRARAGAAGWSTRESYALSATARLLDGRWSNTVAFGTSRAAPNRSTRASLSSEFRLTEAQSVSLRLSTNRFRSPLESEGDFTEYVVQVRVTRRLGS